MTLLSLVEYYFYFYIYIQIHELATGALNIDSRYRFVVKKK